MRKLYVAATEACRSAFECEREVIDFDNANFTEVSIAVMTAEEAKAGKLDSPSARLTSRAALPASSSGLSYCP